MTEPVTVRRVDASEANACIDEGIATREQVDALMVDCFRWPVGPFGMVQGASSGWGQ